MAEHPQVQVTHPSGDLIEVDEDIVLLLNRMWRRGIYTMSSCQDQDGRVWVEFGAQRDVETFVHALFRDDEGGNDIYSFRNRVFSTWRPADDEEEEMFEMASKWWWSFNLMDLNKGEGPVDIEAWHSVRFPRADLSEVVDRL
jgi:hypothetical protein